MQCVSLKNLEFLSFLILSLLIAIIIPTATATATAKDLFTITGNVGGETKQAGFNDAKSAIDFISNQDYNQLFPNYVDDFTKIDTVLDFRGVPLTASYAEGSQDLVFKVDQLGINETFTGFNRDDSADKFADFMLKNGDDLRNRIAKELVAESPVDPLAGNPLSLMGQTVDNTFSMATDRSTNTQGFNAFGFNLRSGSYNLGGLDSNFITIPLMYARDLDQSKKHRLIFVMPLNYTVINGAKAFSAGLNANWQYRATQNWTITPGVQYGITGSYDLLSLGQIISGSLSSAYTWELGQNYKNIRLTLANSGSYMESVPFQVKGMNFNPNLSNYVIRNGIIAEMPVRIDAINKDISLRTYFNDTHFFGSKLFAEQYNEVGAGVDPMLKNKYLQNLTLNGSYIFSAAGDKVEGYSFRFHYLW